MTKENSEFDFKKLDDLVMQQELKEAIENGDMGQVAFCLKHMGIMISQLFEMHKGTIGSQKEHVQSMREFIKNNHKWVEVTTKALSMVNDQFTKNQELLLKLSKRVDALEGKDT